MRKIVFDIDDTLWGLNSRVSIRTGISFDKFISFDLDANTILTDIEKRKILDQYNSIDLFHNIEWFEGIDRINQLNADIYINSNVYLHEIADIKRKQLHEILDIKDDYIQLNYIQDSSPGIKSISKDTYIYVDDSPYNLANSEATYNISLKRPWNTSEHGLNIIKDKPVIWCDSLNTIIDTIEKLLKEDK